MQRFGLFGTYPSNRDERIDIFCPRMLVISLLRGLNVGSYRRISMDALRAVYESLNLYQPTTYAQSGNVLFWATQRDLCKLAARIENGIERGFNFRSQVILRTVSELSNVVDRNPFAARRGFAASNLFVVFLPDYPAADVQRKVLAIKTHPAQPVIDSRELYIYFPNGMAGSKLPMAQIEKTLNAKPVGRKWNSVTKLLVKAKALKLGMRSDRI
jgi:uncharacterized protein (DUF1697 family)